MWSGFRMTGSNPDTDRIWTKNTSWAILILLTFPDPKCLSLGSSGQNQPWHISKAVVGLGRTKDHLALPAWGQTVVFLPMVCSIPQHTARLMTHMQNCHYKSCFLCSWTGWSSSPETWVATYFSSQKATPHAFSQNVSLTDQNHSEF